MQNVEANENHPIHEAQRILVAMHVIQTTITMMLNGDDYTVYDAPTKYSILEIAPGQTPPWPVLVDGDELKAAVAATRPQEPTGLEASDEAVSGPSSIELVAYWQHLNSVIDRLLRFNARLHKIEYETLKRAWYTRWGLN